MGIAWQRAWEQQIDSELNLTEASVGTDLLPRVMDLNARWLSGTAVDAEAVRHGAWLERHRSQGAALTVSVPDASAGLVAWIGRRLAFWPRGVPSGRRVGLASSRLGRDWDARGGWFRLLRTACERTDASRDLLVTSESTAAAKFVQRAAAHFGLRILRVVVPRTDPQSISAWLAQLPSQMAENAEYEGAEGRERYTVYLSPPVESPAAPDGDWAWSDRSDSLSAAPLGDRALVAVSDRLLVFHVRPRGHLHALLHARLGSAHWPPASVFVAIGPGRESQRIATELMDAGAIGWFVTRGLLDEGNSGPSRGGFERAGSTAASSIAASATRWPYLTHCTRRRDGPLPGQSEEEFLDELIFDRSAGDHSALATLRRIVDDQRLAATSQGIRGAYRVVSFTAAPLAELPRLHIFRPHRTRWDFEPYGICIRREFLRACGARPVIYGDEATWQSLANDERPFFQVRSSQTRGRAAAPIDWSAEQEWRHVGDFDLSNVPDHAAVLFVRREAEAAELRTVSRWPVVVVPEAASR